LINMAVSVIKESRKRSFDEADESSVNGIIVIVKGAINCRIG